MPVPRSRRIWGKNALQLPYVGELRRLLEEWLAEFPDGTDKSTLENWLKQGTDDKHYAAVQELALHHELFRREYGIKYELPRLDVSTRPDFSVRTPAGTFLVESVVARDTEADLEQDRRLKDPLENLQQVYPHVQLLALVRSPLPRNFPLRRVREFLMRELSQGWSVDPESPHTFRSEEPYLEIDFYAVAANGTTRQGIADYGFGSARPVTAAERIEHALQRKRPSRYGQLDEPYVVCVSPVLGFHADTAEVHALYGVPRVSLDLQSGRGKWERTSMAISSALEQKVSGSTRGCRQW